MPDDPITRAASEKLHQVVFMPRAVLIVDEVLATIRTMERELNAIKQQSAKSEKPTP